MLIRLSSFEVSVTGLDWVANYEKTRWFLVMQLDRAPQDGLNQLLRISNRVVKSYGQLPLYEEAFQSHAGFRGSKRRGRGDSAPSNANVDKSSSFHVSIGWTLTLPSQDLVDALDRVTEIKEIKVSIRTVKAKIGNHITSIPLVSKVDAANKIIEK